jgi:hypothetical protein
MNAAAMRWQIPAKTALTREYREEKRVLPRTRTGARVMCPGHLILSATRYNDHTDAIRR